MKKVLALAAAVALLTSASPVAAFTLIERGSTFSTHVTLQQAALCDGSVKLAPGAYKVDISSMGDGSVRASFFDRTGAKIGEAHGIIAVLHQGAAPAAGAPAPNAQQKVWQAGAASSIDFVKAGFNENSRSSFRMEGRNLKLEIVSSDGSHAVLIGLLLPAVQRVREPAARAH